MIEGTDRRPGDFFTTKTTKTTTPPPPRPTNHVGRSPWSVVLTSSGDTASSRDNGLPSCSARRLASNLSAIVSKSISLFEPGVPAAAAPGPAEDDGAPGLVFWPLTPAGVPPPPPGLVPGVAPLRLRANSADVSSFRT